MGFFLVTRHFVVGNQLVNVVSRHASLKIAGYGHQVVHGFYAFWSLLTGIWVSVVGRSLSHSIGWMVHHQVLEVLLDIVKILLVSEGKVVDVVGEVK